MGEFDEVLKQVIVVAGSLLIALVAGLISFLGLIISKENKISEMRQSWIDELRKEISTFIASVHFINKFTLAVNTKKKTNGKDEFDYYKIIEEAYKNLVQSNSSIQLRINKEEENSVQKELNTKLMASLDEIKKLVQAKKLKVAIDACEALRDSAAPVIKGQWE